MLNDPRGAVLEAIMSRMRLILGKTRPYRIVAVSATIPNIHNIAQWLRSAQSNIPAKILKFPDSMRPVPLKTHVISVPMNGKNGFTFDFSLNYKLADIIAKHCNSKPTLIVHIIQNSNSKLIIHLFIHTMCIVLFHPKIDNQND